MTLRHVVAWKLAADDAAVRAEQAAKIATDLSALRGAIPEILDITAGADVVGNGNWDVAIVADFADADALSAYLAHPAHQIVVTYIRGVIAERVAVDFEV